MVDCQRVQPSSKTYIGGLTITRATSMKGGKKNKFRFTVEPTLMSKLASPLTVFKKFNLHLLVCRRGLSDLRDTLCRGYAKSAILAFESDTSGVN